MNKPAEKYESQFLVDLLDEIDPKEQAKTDKRMMLVAIPFFGSHYPKYYDVY